MTIRSFLVLVAMAMTRDGLAAVSPSPADQILATWGEVLQAYVHDGKVDYAGIRANEGKRLADFRDRLAAFDPVSIGNSDEAKAFWIHTYNALVVSSLVSAGPGKTAQSVSGFFTRKNHLVGGKRYSLDDIEHRILRKSYADPRMHFALVCGAQSCPVLDPAMMGVAGFEKELEVAARRFVAEERNVRLDDAKKVLHLSSIFKWFEADFTPKYGSVRGFLLQYLPTETADRLRAGEYKVEYDPYDWTLNGR